MRKGVKYKDQNVYLKVNICLNQASSLRFRPVLQLYTNQSTDIWSTLLGWFLYNDNTGLKQANPNLQFFNILFFSFMKNPLSPSVQPKQTYFSQKHKTENTNWNLVENSHKQFYVLLNTNQTKLYTYPDLLKKILYLENFSTQNQQLTF